MNPGFVFVDEAVPGIRWDAKYAGDDNFTGAPVDGYATGRIVGSASLCTALAAAQRDARSHGFGLLVWDAYRPQRAVDAFLQWSRQPEDGRTLHRHYPRITRSDIVRLGYVAAHSAHSRGAAIDLTLCSLPDGRPVDMGGDHDLMDPVSHHGAAGVPARAAANRALLRAIMDAAGFDAYESEWWHYCLREEPFPGTYFDFPITDEVRRPAGATAGAARSAA